MSTDYLKNIAILIEDNSFGEIKERFEPNIIDYGIGAYLFYQPHPQGNFAVSIYPSFRHLVSEEHFNGVLTTVAFLESEFYRLTRESEEAETVQKEHEFLMERGEIQMELIMHGFSHFGETEKFQAYNPEEQYCWGV